MAVTIKKNAINQLQKGETLFEAGMASDCIFVVLKGRGVLANPNLCVPVVSGDFLGVWDLDAGRYCMSCTATEDMAVYAFPAETIADLQTILEGNKEYAGRIIIALGRFITELSARLNCYRHEAGILPDVILELYRQYSICCKAEELRSAYLPAAGEGVAPVSDVPDVLEYYLEAARIPAEVQKSYFSCSVKVALRQMKEQAGLLCRLFAECEKLGGFLRQKGSALINGGADNLFFYFCELEETAVSADAKRTAVLLREVTEKKLEELAVLFEKCAGEAFETYPKRREVRKNERTPAVAVVEPCENSLEQILSYAGVPEETATGYTALVKRFAALKDRLSAEDDVRRLRKQLADGFYQIYEKVFKKAYGCPETEPALPIRLFLEFGFLDETLISRTQLLELEKLSMTPLNDGAGCHIFTIREWLTWVYEGKREPSKNEFDQEYAEMLRELRKEGRITEDEEKAKLTDSGERLHYEIQNLFRYNHRLVNGQTNLFVPFLYEELLAGGPERSFLSKEAVMAAVDRLRCIDYSVFYREFLYRNTELGIEKEYYVREVLPDIILFPTMGCRSIMWQDISCRRRDTPGRFLLPMFSEVAVDDLMIRVCGRYRWELCRTIQGAAWNNVQMKSLTSEYTDYLMCYKKNREISEERKEQIRLQLQKGKNNYCEVFAADYETWMKTEVKGSMKLNKVAREILATYCPFEGKIRAQLSQQPAFEDAMARHRRETAKKLRETELHHHALTKNGVELPQELTDTFLYYRNH